jgi:ATP-binding cassette subfamily E protein 1
VAACLAKTAQLYLLDEPSAFLDIEERLAVARVIRKTVEQNEAFAFVIEHDIVIQDFVADRLMIFSGTPARNGLAVTPSPLREGMNRFLGEMDVTFRRDPEGVCVWCPKSPGYDWHREKVAIVGAGPAG